MDVATVTSVGAVAISLLSLYFSADQVRIQRQLRKDAAQPYVFADIRPHEQHGGLLMFVVGNTGPTVATDVHVSLNRPLPGEPGRDERASRAIAEGISALAPGRLIAWNLGVSFHVLSLIPQGEATYRFTVDARGPFGALPTATYTVDLDDLRQAQVYVPGTLRGIAEEVAKLGKGLTSELQHMRSRLESDDFEA